MSASSSVPGAHAPKPSLNRAFSERSAKRARLDPDYVAMCRGCFDHCGCMTELAVVVLTAANLRGMRVCTQCAYQLPARGSHCAHNFDVERGSAYGVELSQRPERITAVTAGWTAPMECSTTALETAQPQTASLACINHVGKHCSSDLLQLAPTVSTLLTEFGNFFYQYSPPDGHCSFHSMATVVFDEAAGTKERAYIMRCNASALAGLAGVWDSASVQFQSTEANLQAYQATVEP